MKTFDNGINSVWNTDTTAGPFFCLPVRHLNTVKMKSYEYNFCLSAVNIGIFCIWSYSKGLETHNVSTYLCIIINNSRKMTMFVHILPEISLYKSNNISNIDHFVSIQISYRKNWSIHSPSNGVVLIWTKSDKSYQSYREKNLKCWWNHYQS